MAKQRGIAVVRPALGPEEQIREQELSEGVPDSLRIPIVRQRLAQEPTVAQPLRQLPQEQRSRISAQALGPGLRSDAAVEIRLKQRTLLFTHGVCWGKAVEGWL